MIDNGDRAYTYNFQCTNIRPDYNIINNQK